MEGDGDDLSWCIVLNLFTKGANHKFAQWNGQLRFVLVFELLDQFAELVSVEAGGL